MIEGLCIICGHVESEHRLKSVIENWYPDATHWCYICSRDNKFDPPTMFHNFKMDNLQLVEDLAKERKLI